MGIFVCLNEVKIHHVDINKAIHFKDIKSFEKIQDDNHDFIFFGKASHKIKKKAEQMACQHAIELIHSYY